jgi:hypothetical protein
MGFSLQCRSAALNRYVKSQNSPFSPHSIFLIGFREGMTLYILIRKKKPVSSMFHLLRKEKKKKTAVFLLEI